VTDTYPYSATTHPQAAKEPRRRFTADEAAAVEATLQSSGYHLLLELIQSHAARCTTALTREKTDWDEVNRLRGELRGLGWLLPSAVRKQYPASSDNP